ncbi:MAG TPA: NAD-dependent epimerase/dehydratase family protein [Chitinophagales bacterium]|nr:NAD-dependent epimerase/dehydratase family protein [Chitinophagales bacterium]
MHALVTGANGFIGSNLCKQLIQNGHTVTAMVLPGTSLVNLQGIACTVIYADITDPTMLDGKLKGIDTVYHLAALPSMAWGSHVFKVNYNGTKNMLEEAVKSKVKRFVFMSSLVVHGFNNYHNADETTPPLKPGFFTRPYIASKVKCEELIQEYRGRLETVIIRPGFNIYGPNDRLTSKEMLDRLSQQKLMGYVNKGDTHLGYVYAENLAFGLLCAGTHPVAAGNTYIIADYEPPYIDLKDLQHRFAVALGITAKLTSVPSVLFMPVAFLIDVVHFLFLRSKMPLISTYIVNAGTHHLHFSSAKAQREIGYRQLVSYEEGIKRTVDWYKAETTAKP